MEFINTLVDLFIHLDQHLADLISFFGPWIYVILFLVIFCETGLVVTPFLPGDSLLFAAGAIAAATGEMNVVLLVILLSAAAVLGDSANYAIGHYIGPRVFSENIRFLKREYLDRTHAFYEKHGGKTIILARFIPIVRTFAPFIAGVGTMSYGRFISFNIIGGLIWVPMFTLTGYFFGNLPFVKEHFELIVLAIIGISVIPAVYEIARAKLSKASVKSP